MDSIGLVAVTSCIRRVKLKRQVAESFCTQRCVIGTGPAMLGDRQLFRIKYKVRPLDIGNAEAAIQVKKFDVYKGVRLPKYAIRDYMSTCKDVALLAHAGVGRAAVSSTMLEATFGNLVTEEYALDTIVQVDQPDDNHLSIYKTREAAWNNWHRFTPMGAVVHMLVPGRA